MTTPYAAAVIPSAKKAGHVKGHTFFVRHSSDPGQFGNGTSTSSMDVPGDVGHKTKHQKPDRFIDHTHQRGHRVWPLQLGARDADVLSLKQPTSWKDDDGFWRHRSHPAPYTIDICDKQKRLPRVLASRVGYARQPRRMSPPQAHSDVARNFGNASTTASSPVLPAARPDHCRGAQDELGERIQTLENIFGKNSSAPSIKKISHRIEALAQPRKDFYHETGLQVINSLSEDDLERPVRRPPRRAFRVPALPKRYCNQDSQDVPSQTSKKSPSEQSATKGQTQSKKSPSKKKDVFMAEKVSRKDEIIPHRHEDQSCDVHAATRIQSVYRGHVARNANASKSNLRQLETGRHNEDNTLDVDSQNEARGMTSSQRSDSPSRSAVSSETESDRSSSRGSSARSRTSHAATSDEPHRDLDDARPEVGTPRSHSSYSARSRTSHAPTPDEPQRDLHDAPLEVGTPHSQTSYESSFEAATPKNGMTRSSTQLEGIFEDDTTVAPGAADDDDGFEVSPTGTHTFGTSNAGVFKSNFDEHKMVASSDTDDNDGFEVSPKGNLSLGASNTGVLEAAASGDANDNDGFEVSLKENHSFGASNSGVFEESCEKNAAAAASVDADDDDGFEVSPKGNHSIGASNISVIEENCEKDASAVASGDADDDDGFEVSPTGDRSLGAAEVSPKEDRSFFSAKTGLAGILEEADEDLTSEASPAKNRSSYSAKTGFAGILSENATAEAGDMDDDDGFEVSPKGNKPQSRSNTFESSGYGSFEEDD